MWRVAQSVILAGLFVGVSPAGVQAQWLRALLDPCGACRHPVDHCTCLPAVTVAPTVMQPVVETTYRQELQTTYRDVPHVEYRQQAHVETVPVTAYRQQVIDEGHYAKVWVPKLVTRHIPETTYQQRMSYQTVPFQTTRRVAQTETRLVPQQTVRHVPQPAAIAACDPCGPGFPAVSGYWPATLPTTAYLPQVPVTAGNAFVPTPVPDPQFAASSPAAPYDDWSTIQSQTAGAPALDALDERLGDYRMAEPPTPARTAGRATGKFVPAPSAARVWNSPTFQR